MEDQKINILYIDDEQNNLVSFKANFRKLYNVFTAATIDEAMMILQNNVINIIFTDQKMPHLSGVEFLESIIKDHPFPVRMIVTGYADIDSVIQAINKGRVYRYILKPFDVEELKLVIESAYDLYLFRKTNKEITVRYKHLFDSANAAIFLVDIHGTFIEMNKFGLDLFKIKTLDITHCELLSLFLNADQYKKLYGNLIVNESVHDIPLKLKSTNNEIIDVLFSASKITMNDNEIVFQGMMRDITKEKEIENLVLRTIIETQEVERTRFSKNLHDSVGSMLAAIKLQLYNLTNENQELKNNPQLQNVFESLNSTIVEIRNISFNIMPASLNYMGLQIGIEDLIAHYEKNCEIKFNYTFPEDFPKQDAQLELAIFRIIQEYINNALTHGKASVVSILITVFQKRIYLSLKDNGCGFNVKSTKAGLGLKNIRSRVMSFNGEVKINSALGAGTDFEIMIPMASQEEVFGYLN